MESQDNDQDAIKYIENKPDAARLASGMRDTGYNFNTAATDIIDNSIAAGAGKINVSIDLVQIDGEWEQFIFFGDDGTGMDRDGIFDGMRYGAPKRINSKSLGKFGLGLKTASTSVCRRLAVISKDKPDAPLNKFIWDLDHIDKCGEWEMIEGGIEQYEIEKYDELCGKTGTLVVWSMCDRILKNSQYEPGSTEERAALKRLSNNLRTHVEMIYHKFLDTSNADFKNITLNIDGEEAKPWNPFFPEDSEQVLSPKKQILRVAVDSAGGTHDATIKAWILPHRKDLEAAKGSDYMKSAKINNPNQGFYVYREGRMIHNGDWLGIWKARDPHYSLIRVELDFDNELDEAFETDVRKTKIIFDENVAAYLKALLENPREEANKRYRRTQKKVTTSGINHATSNKRIKNSGNKEQPTVTNVNPTANTVTLTGAMGTHTIQLPIFSQVSPNEVHVTPTGEINNGDFWEVSLNSESDADYQVAARINKHHEFYTKVYSKSGGDVVDGIDFLIWSLASAEASHTTKEMKAFWDDVRAVVSRNLRTLLQDYDIPTNI